MQTAQIDAMRRAGELYAVRQPGSLEWIYPSWQFDRHGQVRPVVPRLIAAARESGLKDEALRNLLERRVGLVGGGRKLVDLVLAGEDDQAVAVLRAAAAA